MEEAEDPEIVTIDDEPDVSPTLSQLTVTPPASIKERIERVIDVIIQDISARRAPYLEVRAPQENVQLRKIELFLPKSRETFTKVLCLMLKSYGLIIRGERQNKRDIYYENILLYRNQQKLDDLIKVLCAVLRVPRWELNIEASAKGLIVGPLKWKDAQNDVCEVNLRAPSLIPSNQTGFHDFESDARFILIIEKDAIFKKVLEENCFEALGSFLLLTAKGYPDYATRRFLNKLIDSLNIRTFILVDADPHGLQIAATYRWGSKGCLDPELCSPNIELLGVLPSELDFLSFGQDRRLVMTDREVKRLDALESRMNDETWKKEVKVLRTSRTKAEIENLSTSSPNFLTQVYLKAKINAKLLN